MKIVCLVKQVPRADAIEFDPETKSLRREGVPLLLNPFDAAAVAHAVELKEHGSVQVIAMTMGPPQAQEALHACLALGADRCIHLSDRAFAVADTIGTSRTLALAIEKEGGVDLVLCGRKATDSETSQVPPETAAFLGWPHLTQVVPPIGIADGRIRATRETDGGYDTYSVCTPAVLSFAGALDFGATSDGAIDLWSVNDLVDDSEENDKRFGQTGSPTRVLAVRDVSPDRAGDVFDSADDAVARVRALLHERTNEPSSWDKPERLGEKPGKAYDCWTLVEHRDGQAARVSLELLGKGRELAGKLGGKNVALVLGADVGEVAREAGRHGAERVVVADDRRFGIYDPEVWSDALQSVVMQAKPHVLLIPATAFGRDIGPRVAGELQLGMTADCVGLGIDRAGRLIQTKPAYGGNIVSVIMGSTTPQLATVRPRMFEPLVPRDLEIPAEGLALGPPPRPSMRLVEQSAAPAGDLDEADVVVCIGTELAEVPHLPPGVALGGTREVCARGLLPRNRHLGLLGRAVAPRLLIAVGVSGDFEELTAFVKADVIAAVNGDARSPMLRAADVGVAGDWRELLPAFLELN
ncbi:MAG: electron transfer flavoprotein alpha subunit [Gaiellaceae bacterium]|nr:electron transfer flavoprotein alpha subunit [Gaiellaceae bacterium]